MENHLEEILVELKSRDIKFVVCGGVAAVLHGVERMTMDIDISLDMDKERNIKESVIQRKIDVVIPCCSVLC